MASDERAVVHKPQCLCVRCEDVKQWLAAQGLHVVTDAEMRVLEAMAAFTLDYLHLLRTSGTVVQSNLAVAELARREAAEATFDRAVVWDGGPVRREGKP